MKERPILFSSAMVRAILDGSKTQTRRVINPQPNFVSGGWHWAHKSYDNGDGAHYFHTDEECAKRLLLKAGIAPKAGNIRWVKETFAPVGKQGTLSGHIRYKADEKSAIGAYGSQKWKPSIFMPRWASRITLEITAVRVERLHDISEEDAMAEGCKNNRVICPVCGFVIRRAGNPGAMCPEYSCEGDLRRETFKEAFAELWDSIQLQRSKPKGAFAWSQNPWVYAISFKRLNRRLK